MGKRARRSRVLIEVSQLKGAVGSVERLGTTCVHVKRR